MNPGLIKTCCAGKVLNLFLVVVFFGFTHSIGAWGQCQFSVTHSNINDHCLYATEEVVWSKTGLSADVTTNGNNLDKTSGTDGWNAGAASVSTVKNNGWVTSVISEVNKARAFGLSNADVNVNYTSIQYYFNLRADGNIEVYDPSSPAPRTNFGYQTGKILKIAVDNNVVKYYYDNQLMYMSAVAPTLPLLVDVSFYHVGATLRTVEVTNGSDGSFTASAPAVDLGLSPAYQWYLNGAALPGATNSTYSNASLTAGDQLYCQLTPGAGGCSLAAVNSNKVSFQLQSSSVFGDYYSSNSAVSEACLNAREEVAAFAKTNVGVTGNDLVKDYGWASGVWDAGAFSTAAVLNNGYAETTIAETDKNRAFGLSSSDGGLNISSIQYAFFFRDDLNFEIYESGSSKVGLLPYATGQVYSIRVEGGQVKYYRNSTLLYISSTVPTLPLHVDVSFWHLGGTIKDIFINNGSTGVFTATASVTGASPSYQWLLNGAPVATGNSYSNPASQNGDQVQCIIHPDLVGCTVTTPIITIASRNYGGTFYIANSPSVIACAITQEEIQPTDKVNVTVSGNNITKAVGNSGFWDAGATSLNLIYNNGYAETTLAETNTTRLFGLSSNAAANTHSSSNETKIQYGFVFYNGGAVAVYESGAWKAWVTGYATGDVYRIKVDNGVVRYYKGSSTIPLYSSAIVPALPFVVDLSLQDLGATLNNIVVSNGCTGVFNAVASNAGPSPSYQWTVNGINVGTNSPSYSNSNLAAGDVVRCTLTPDITGCVASQDSNLITVNLVGGALSPATTWTGSVSTAWENSSNWSNGIPNGYVKVTIPSGTPRNPVLNSAAGVYDLTIQSGAAFSIAGSNNLIVFDQWNNQGGFTANTSKLSLKNCTNNANQLNVSVAGNTFYDLEINNTYGASMGGSHSVAYNLVLTDGIVTPLAAGDMVIVKDEATATGASTKSFINGKVKKVGNNAFTFPVGKSGTYRPFSITAPTLNTDEFVAEYFKTSYVTVDPSTWPSGLRTISKCEYWNLDRAVGVSTPDVTLSWTSSQCDETKGAYVSDPSQLIVVGFDGTNWKGWGNGATSGTAASGSITNGSAITSYGPFTLGSLISGNVLPVELLKFESRKQSNVVQLSWTTASENHNDYFELEKSTSGADFKSISHIEAVGNSKQNNSYESIDRKPVKGLNYYRLKQVDDDGNFSYSDILSVYFDSDIGISAFPNPVKSGEGLEIICSCEKYWILDPITTKVIKSFEGEFTLKTDSLSPGVYLLIDEQWNKYTLVVM